MHLKLKYINCSCVACGYQSSHLFTAESPNHWGREHSLWSEQPLTPICNIEAAAPLVAVLNKRLDLLHRRRLVHDSRGQFRAASKQR